MQRRADIKFSVALDDNKFPTEIIWEATDAGMPGKRKSDCMLVSLWDTEQKNTLSLDLWTNEMLVDDMNIHFYQTFAKLADTYESASRDPETANMIRGFANQFAEKLKLFPPQQQSRQ